MVPETLQLRFTVADAHTTMAVRHQGNPPDLFAEGRGVVLEGRLLRDGTSACGSTMSSRPHPSCRPWISIPLL
jgi:cytochrome c-type biogenesis protein CcmE